ncbi:EscE/YscE/SsaE family type III secretion system needle protein co-chaperone [Yersinia similis]|uniref:EscE/YscE/SsaE family type III secretion system needle protein co-chaperone n=1 Tax=Yersinia similis TaxID=367190 RepID=UPI00119E7E7C|nr:EscE/YscE/SsaE family type III secretion system needle protein co-chaperone [Yersinia similis]
MRHITVLEEDIKHDPAAIQQRKEVLAKGRKLITYQLSQLHTQGNYQSLNNIMLALQRAEEIIEILTLRYGNKK